jgi:mRNA interferase MazF
MRRPVLVVTRSEAVPVLTGIVAPLTRTIRDILAEVKRGVAEGLDDDCVASFHNLQRIRRSSLTQMLGELGERHSEICVVLSALADCT